MNLSPHPIHVLFVEAETGNMFADARIPADQLPQTFTADVILPLREDYWRVVGADPVKAEDFIRAGKLVLIVEKVHPSSLPEDTGSFPELG